MGRLLAVQEPVVAATFREADRVMTPILGKPLTSFIFVDADDAEAMNKAELDLMQTAITQPAMLTMDISDLQVAWRVRHRTGHRDGPLAR